MRYDRKSLYDSLGSICVDIEKALAEENHEAISIMTEKHNMIMEDLYKAGEEKDPDMRVVIESANIKVKQLISTIKTMQSDIRDQLTAMNNRKLIQSRYQSKDAR